MNRNALALGLALTLTSAALIVGCGGGDTPAPATASKPATAATSDAKAMADKLIADATQYIKDNKWDLADKSVAQLDSMKSSLTPDNAKRVDDLKALLSKAEAATRAVPKMP